MPIIIINFKNEHFFFFHTHIQSINIYLIPATLCLELNTKMNKIANSLSPQSSGDQHKLKNFIKITDNIKLFTISRFTK